MKLLFAIACAMSVSCAFAATGVLHDWDPDKGSGYIAPDGGGTQKVSVSSSGVLEADRKLLKPGALVSYDMEHQGQAGAHARNVHVTGAGSAPTTDVLGQVKGYYDTKGFGYITAVGGDGKDIVVRSGSIKMQGHPVLTTGQRVRYDLETGQRGAEAVNVRPIN
jgi:cold shock protein